MWETFGSLWSWTRVFWARVARRPITEEEYTRMEVLVSEQLQRHNAVLQTVQRSQSEAVAEARRCFRRGDTILAAAAASNAMNRRLFAKSILESMGTMDNLLNIIYRTRLAAGTLPTVNDCGKIMSRYDYDRRIDRASERLERGTEHAQNLAEGVAAMMDINVTAAFQSIVTNHAAGLVQPDELTEEFINSLDPTYLAPKPPPAEPPPLLRAAAATTNPALMIEDLLPAPPKTVTQPKAPPRGVGVALS